MLPKLVGGSLGGRSVGDYVDEERGLALRLCLFLGQPVIKPTESTQTECESS